VHQGYLFTAVRNLVYDFYRKLQRDQVRYQQFKEAITEHWYNPVEEILQTREGQAPALKAPSTLPPQQRKALQLCRMANQLTNHSASSLTYKIRLFTYKQYLIGAH
jgi:DNA-directed RNA polymerase specialized sigma24 family protein